MGVEDVDALFLSARRSDPLNINPAKIRDDRKQRQQQHCNAACAVVLRTKVARCRILIVAAARPRHSRFTLCMLRFRLAALAATRSLQLQVEWLVEKVVILEARVACAARHASRPRRAASKKRSARHGVGKISSQLLVAHVSVRPCRCAVGDRTTSKGARCPGNY